jgi:hypothetical protein
MSDFSSERHVKIRNARSSVPKTILKDLGDLPGAARAVVDGLVAEDDVFSWAEALLSDTISVSNCSSYAAISASRSVTLSPPSATAGTIMLTTNPSTAKAAARNSKPLCLPPPLSLRHHPVDGDSSS